MELFVPATHNGPPPYGRCCRRTRGSSQAVQSMNLDRVPWASPPKLNMDTPVQGPKEPLAPPFRSFWRARSGATQRNVYERANPKDWNGIHECTTCVGTHLDFGPSCQQWRGYDRRKFLRHKKRQLIMRPVRAQQQQREKKVSSFGLTAQGMVSRDEKLRQPRY